MRLSTDRRSRGRLPLVAFVVVVLVVAVALGLGTLVGLQAFAGSSSSDQAGSPSAMPSSLPGSDDARPSPASTVVSPAEADQPPSSAFNDRVGKEKRNVTPGDPRPRSGELLVAPDVIWPVGDFISTEHGVLRVDISTNRVTAEPNLISNPERTRLMKVGGMPAALGIDGELVAITSNEGLVAFTEPFEPGHGIYEPGPRISSEIVVVNTETETGHAVPRSYSFDANVVPEVFTADRTGLFVIDHVPADGPVGYRVKLLTLATGQLEDVLGPWKRPPSEYMEGIGRRQLGDPNGERLFTLYTRQPANHGQLAGPQISDSHVSDPHVSEQSGGGASLDAHNESGTHDHQTSDHAAAGPMHGFVHTLSLTDEWAICIDLPAPFGQGAPETAALATDDGGAKLFVVDANAGDDSSRNGGSGMVAVFDTVDMATDRVQQAMPEPSLLAPVELADDIAVSAIVVNDPDLDAATSPKGAFARSLVIAQGQRVQYLNVASRLEVTRTHTFDFEVEDLVTDPDGRAFAVVDGRLVPLPQA